MIITVNTKIAAILKHRPLALNAIISISPAFQKLRNPLLRKLMAGRTSITMAAKLGNCRVEDFFQKLEPLGFTTAIETAPAVGMTKQLPDFMKVTSTEVEEIDVRPLFLSGSDPLTLILEKVKNLKPGAVLKVTNSFEPTPLIHLLEKKGWEAYVDAVTTDHVETYFHKYEDRNITTKATNEMDSASWSSAVQQFKERLTTIDVRHLPMPQPMLTIMDALEKIEPYQALYVRHKRVPVFLLPELYQKGFDYRIKEVCENEVHLLIFKS